MSGSEGAGERRSAGFASLASPRPPRTGITPLPVRARRARRASEAFVGVFISQSMVHLYDASRRGRVGACVAAGNTICTRAHARAGHSHADGGPNTHGGAPAAPAAAHPARVAAAQKVWRRLGGVSPTRNCQDSQECCVPGACVGVRLLETPRDLRTSDCTEFP